MRGAEINGCPGHYHPAVWYKPSKLCQIVTKFAEEAIKSPRWPIFRLELDAKNAPKIQGG